MRKITVTYCFRDKRTVPMLRLSGEWLKRAGFEEGRHVSVDVGDGRLVLAVEKEAERCLK
jgi:Toxin SymE, type I toxin-antitoxin system